MTKEIKQAIQKGFATTGKHTADVLGDKLGQAVDDAKKMTGVLFSPLIGALKKDKPSKADKKRNSLLEEMVNYFGKAEKAACDYRHTCASISGFL